VARDLLFSFLPDGEDQRLLARSTILFNSRINSHNGFRHLPNTGKKSLDLFTLLLKISERRDTKISEQAPVATAKPLLHLHGRIVVEHPLTP